MLRVEPPTIRDCGDLARIESRLLTSRGPEALWYELDRQYAPHLTLDRLDGFAVAALLVAMERGEGALEIAGPVSERLLYNLQHQLVPLLRQLKPELSAVSIRAKAIRSDASHRGRGVATGFSGGIDSACTIAEHLDPARLPDYKLTHLLFCNVGSHDRGDAGRRLFLKRLELLRKPAAVLGLPLVVVDSNLTELLEGRFEPTLTPRTASAALLLQGLFSVFLHSSSHQYAHCSLGRTDYGALADPVVAPLLSTDCCEIVSAGSRYSRVAKTRIALQLPGLRDYLNVCIHPRPDGRNCSSCVKCLRTLATLDMLGELTGFERVFDLDLYRRWTHRLQYLALLPGRLDDNYIQELYDLAQTDAARLPLWISAVHHWWPLAGLPYEAAKSARRLIKRFAA